MRTYLYINYMELKNDFQLCLGIGEDTMKLAKAGIVLAIGSLMSICMVLCPGAMASDVFTVRDGVLVEYNGTDLYVVIPEDVMAIGERAFAECEGIGQHKYP